MSRETKDRRPWGRRLSRLALTLAMALWFVAGIGLAQQGSEAQGAAGHEDDGHDHADHDHPVTGADEHAHADDEHADHDHHDHEHGGAGLAGIRLLLGEAGSPSAYVVSAENGEVVGSFTVPGVSRVEQLADTRYGALVHTDANRVTFVYSGLSAVDHGDHMDLLIGNPYVAATINTGRNPLHFASYGNGIAVFNEADGTVALLDARLLGISVDYETVTAAGPDHGAVVPLDDALVIGLLAANSVEVHDAAGKLIDTFADCAAPHGQARLGDAALFGCANGVLVVRETAPGQFAADLIATPTAADGVRVGSLVSRGGERYIVGNFGEGFAVIDPTGLTLATYGTEGTQLGGVLFDDGTTFARLGSDGWLRSFDLATGSELAALAVVRPLAQGAVRPSVTSAGDLAFVTDPATQQVVVVDLDTLLITDRLELGFVPDGVAILQLPGAVLH